MPDASIPQDDTILAISKLVRRSDRQLQRDINDALESAKGLEKKPDILHNVRLEIRKKGEQTKSKRGIECEPGEAESIRDSGKRVKWFINVRWSVEEYGLRPGVDAPGWNPSRHLHSTESADTEEAVDSVVVARKDTSDSEIIDIEINDEPGASNPAADHSTLPNDYEYLKQRIIDLEREKQQEMERYEKEVARNEKREEKLFGQLGVKDNQISKWDEVTQGIVRGIATGQLKADRALPAGGQLPENKRGNGDADGEEVQNDEQAHSATTSHATKPIAQRTKKKTRSNKTPEKKATPTKPKPKSGGKSKTSPKDDEKAPSKPEKKSKWQFWA